MHEIFFSTLWHEMVPLGPTKGKPKLIRKNDFSLTTKTLKFSSLIQNICMFLQKETSHWRIRLSLHFICTKHYVFGNQFYSKNARKLKFNVFLHIHARKHMI